MSELLLVDDEIESRQSIRAMIESSEYNYFSVYEAETYVEGLSLLKQLNPTVLISELSLPDGNGLTLCKEALRWNPSLFVMINTYLKMFDTVCEAINAGFSAYLLKPVSKSELLAIFDRLSITSSSRSSNGIIQRRSESIQTDPGNPIETAMKYIQSHFERPVTLKEIADFVYLSPSHFSRLFKEYTGLTFVEYLAEYRVKKSKVLLKSTSLPIEVIAHRMGFSSAAYFSTTFKRIEGRTPSEFRNVFLNLAKKPFDSTDLNLKNLK